MHYFRNNMFVHIILALTYILLHSSLDIDNQKKENIFIPTNYHIESAIITAFHLYWQLVKQNGRDTFSIFNFSKLKQPLG